MCDRVARGRPALAVRAAAYRRPIGEPLPQQPSHEHLQGAFGPGGFGSLAERTARFFGTPRYIVAQTVLVILWIAVNAAAVSLRWDPYPFILLNLAFSTQAAYAAPLILLAQTRQAERDKANAEVEAEHREQIARHHEQLLEANTRLTEQVERLTQRLLERLG
jgi:uncharacterized membrane protein